MHCISGLANCDRGVKLVGCDERHMNPIRAKGICRSADLAVYLSCGSYKLVHFFACPVSSYFVSIALFSMCWGSCRLRERMEGGGGGKWGRERQSLIKKNQVKLFADPYVEYQRCVDFWRTYTRCFAGKLEVQRLNRFGEGEGGGYEWYHRTESSEHR